MNSEQDPADALRNIHQVRSGMGSTLPVSARLSAGAFQDSTYLTLDITEAVRCLRSLRLHCERCQYW